MPAAAAAAVGRRNGLKRHGSAKGDADKDR
jgi:hypothetical protein